MAVASAATIVIDESAARPAGDRRDVRFAVAKAELELVAQRSGIDERRTVEAVLLLRTQRVDA